MTRESILLLRTSLWALTEVIVVSCALGKETGLERIRGKFPMEVYQAGAQSRKQSVAIDWRALLLLRLADLVKILERIVSIKFISRIRRHSPR